MSKKEVVVTEFPVLEKGIPAARIVKVDGVCHVYGLNDDTDYGAITKIGDKGRSYVLPANPSNRKWANVKQLTELEEGGVITITYNFGTSPSAHGPKMPGSKFVKYLDEEQVAQLNAIFERTKAAMTETRTDDVTAQQIKALKALKTYKELIGEDTADVDAQITALKGTGKTFIDFMSEEDYAAYNDLMTIAESNKANAPKAPRGHKPLTAEQKLARAKKKYEDAQKVLDELLAAQGIQ